MLIFGAFLSLINQKQFATELFIKDKFKNRQLKKKIFFLQKYIFFFWILECVSVCMKL